MDKKVQLKLWALQKGYPTITALAEAAGITRAALYQAIRYKPGHGIYPPIGRPALLKIAEALDVTEYEIYTWYNGKELIHDGRRKGNNSYA